MSTKCTILHSRKDNWHFYFDYADMRTHLTIGRKEVINLPESFLHAAKEAMEIVQSIDYTNSRAKKFGNRCLEDK